MTSTVLVVEDDPEISTLLDRLLTSRGFRVITAANGAEALAVTVRPSVIVLDLWMPVLDGAGFLEAQASAPLVAGVPVIVVSATGTTETFPRPVFAVMTKPVAVARMIAAIHEACAAEPS